MNPPPPTLTASDPLRISAGNGAQVIRVSPDVLCRVVLAWKHLQVPPPPDVLDHHPKAVAYWPGREYDSMIGYLVREILEDTLRPAVFEVAEGMGMTVVRDGVASATDDTMLTIRSGR